jgi:ketosteroid isomerase-like protein
MYACDMKKTMKAVTLTATLTVLAGCAGSPPNPERESAALLAADQAFAALSERTDARTAFDAYLAPDGMMFPRGADGPVVGHDKAMALFGDGKPGYSLLWQPQFAEVAPSGDMGWTWGKYQVVTGGETIDTGKYINVWKKQEDGSWKVRTDFGSPDAAKPQ